MRGIVENPTAIAADAAVTFNDDFGMTVVAISTANDHRFTHRFRAVHGFRWVRTEVARDFLKDGKNIPI